MSLRDLVLQEIWCKNIRIAAPGADQSPRCFLTSLGLNLTAERQGVRSRMVWSFPCIIFCPQPGHAAPWAGEAGLRHCLVSGSAQVSFRSWAAAITKEFAVSWLPFVDLSLVLYFAKYQVKDYFRTSDAQKHSYIRFFLKVIIAKALPLSWTVKNQVKSDSIPFSYWWQIGWRHPFCLCRWTRLRIYFSWNPKEE